MPQKSLFAYFTSPKAAAAGDKINEKEGSEKSVTKEAKSTNTKSKLGKRTSDVSPSSKENKKPKRRRRVILSESEDESANEGKSSGDEFKPDNKMEESSESDDNGSQNDESEGTNSAKARKKVTKIPSMSSTPKLSKFTASTPCDSPSNNSSNLGSGHSPSVGQRTLSKLSSFTAPPDAGEVEGVYGHQSLEFLKADKIRDKERRLRNDPDYDSRTLHIPDDYMKSTTPGMRQWWVLKESHFDTILFFKMGKFYEFFHMDADVGVKELGLVYMKGNNAHAGFPEIAYGRYADTLLRKGYKIARIEQTETPDMMAERLDQSTAKVTKFDKVVKREVCQITTPGTRTPNFLDGETIDVASNYLLAVCEKPGDKCSQVGVCFLDTSTSRFHIGQFEDDIYGSRLRTLTAHYVPGQVLYEKRSNSNLLSHLFKTTLSSIMKEALVSGKEFWSSEQTIAFLSEAEYFKTDANSQATEWPDVLKSMLDDSDVLGRKPKSCYELAVRCLGAIVWYLRFSYLDHDILSLRQFSEYIPLDHQPADRPIDNSRMVMDSVTLANLDILVNQSTGTAEGSLLERLDRCKTAGGKRLLREWLTAPLCDHRLINDRLEAVNNLVSMGDLSPLQNDVMRKLPDFERLLSRVHMLGHAKRSKEHPDSRAIMFESDIYSKRKIDSFLSLVDGFQTALEVVDVFKSIDITSNVLKKCVTFKQDGGHLADVRPLLKYFGEAFDHQAARKAGAIHPAKGYVEEYDEAVEEMQEINDELADYLSEQKKLLSSQVVYMGTGRNRFQLEVPEAACKRVPAHYEVTGQRKGYKRYITAHIKSLLSRMMEAEEKQVLGLKDTMRKIFNKFDESYNQWMDVVQCMNVLDVLLSLATYTMSSEGVMCRPVLIPSSASSTLSLHWHPDQWKMESTFTKLQIVPL